MALEAFASGAAPPRDRAPTPVEQFDQTIAKLVEALTPKWLRIREAIYATDACEARKRENAVLEVYVRESLERIESVNKVRGRQRIADAVVAGLSHTPFCQKSDAPPAPQNFVARLHDGMKYILGV